MSKRHRTDRMDYFREAEKYLKGFSSFEDAPEVKQLLEGRVPVTYLNPQRAAIPIPPTLSKWGGIPNLGSTGVWPSCPHCECSMQFTLQLYKDEFPEFWYPPGRNLFQIFRCPNSDCTESFAHNLYDVVTICIYTDSPKELARSIEPNALHNCPDVEADLPECELNPVRTLEIAYLSLELSGNPHVIRALGEILHSEYSPLHHAREVAPDLLLFVESKFGPLPHGLSTKIGGIPFWQQDPQYPVDQHGNEKAFLFQLGSSENAGIMIGDSGNVYFFYDPEEAEGAIETRWDCG